MRSYFSYFCMTVLLGSAASAGALEQQQTRVQPPVDGSIAQQVALDHVLQTSLPADLRHLCGSYLVDYRLAAAAMSKRVIPFESCRSLQVLCTEHDIYMVAIRNSNGRQLEVRRITFGEELVNTIELPEEVTVDQSEMWIWVALSRDGKKLAFALNGPQNCSAHVYDLENRHYQMHVAFERCWISDIALDTNGEHLAFIKDRRFNGVEDFVEMANEGRNRGLVYHLAEERVVFSQPNCSKIYIWQDAVAHEPMVLTWDVFKLAQVWSLAHTDQPLFEFGFELVHDRIIVAEGKPLIAVHATQTICAIDVQQQCLKRLQQFAPQDCSLFPHTSHKEFGLQGYSENTYGIITEVFQGYYPNRAQNKWDFASVITWRSLDGTKEFWRHIGFKERYQGSCCAYAPIAATTQVVNQAHETQSQDKNEHLLIVSVQEGTATATGHTGNVIIYDFDTQQYNKLLTIAPSHLSVLDRMISTGAHGKTVLEQQALRAVQTVDPQLHTHITAYMQNPAHFDVTHAQYQARTREFHRKIMWGIVWSVAAWSYLGYSHRQGIQKFLDKYNFKRLGKLWSRVSARKNK